MKPITGITIGGICLVIAAVSFFAFIDTASIYAVEEIIISPCQQRDLDAMDIIKPILDYDWVSTTLEERVEFAGSIIDSMKEKTAKMEQKYAKYDCPEITNDWLTDEYKVKLQQMYETALLGK